MLHCMPKVCLVIPCHNEANRLQSDVIIEYLLDNDWLHICFVNDGSTDQTNDVLISIRNRFNKQVSVVTFKTNCGKAEAVRKGIIKCIKDFHPDLVGFLDADLATPFTEINKLLQNSMNYKNAVMFTGCRILRLGASIERKWYRHYLGRIFASFAAIALDLPVYDTQCGAKIFQSDMAGKVFCKPFLSRWFFDVEIFARIAVIIGKSSAKKEIIEVPLQEWKDKDDSKLSAKQYFVAAIDLLKIFLKYRKKMSRIT